MRSEDVHAALAAPGPTCRISAEEFSSRLGGALEEFQPWAYWQETIAPPDAVRKHWGVIRHHLKAL